MDLWKGLLESATVALELPDGRGGGTGFVLAPGTVVTCAHVVAGADTVRGRISVTGQEFPLTVSAGDSHRSPGGLDVAFLRFDPGSVSPRPGPVLTSAPMRLGDRLWAYGHPRGTYRAGQGAALEYQGESRVAFADAVPLPRGYGTPVGEGFSGSPVVNLRTGAVCGMLTTSNEAGSAHMIPIAEITARLPGAEPSAAWVRTLTDEQITAAGLRRPGPLLRDYLRAAREEADEHPYAALLTDAGDVPLSTVYVRQEASSDDAPDDHGARQRRRVPNRPAESVLAEERHVLFTGGAGVGKSSLLRRLTYVAAQAWLEDPAQAPPYVPVQVAAGELTNGPFPEALAAAVGRGLPGLRRSPRPEMFDTGPLPQVDWLVCVDGLDEVLDPEERGTVIRLVQRWAREPHLRFVVASRSLVTAEMNRLGALGRYVLEGLGDAEIEQVATAWFQALGVSDAVRRAAGLAGEVRHGRLGEVARNPLYLTMICVVAAVRDLPRTPDELYGRFLAVLREKGARRLARGGGPVHGITPDLLDRVHEVLLDVAERRQGGDRRPLLDQARELLREHHPGLPAARDEVFRALTFTGLVRQQGTELHFLHHTIQEYLAAQALADRHTPKDAEALRVVRRAIAGERPNLVLFMAARWHAQGIPLEEFLRTVADSGGWRDLLLCATVLSDEPAGDEELTGRFTRAVIKLHGRRVHVGDLTVETVLDRLYAVLDEDGLAAVVCDPSVPHAPRLGALRHLVRRGGDRAAALAAALAGDDALPAALRVEAARLLADAGEHAQACARLALLAEDADCVPESRLKAALALLDLDQEAATAALCGVLRTTDFPQEHVEDLERSLPASTDPPTRTALADSVAANPVVAGAGPGLARYLRAVLLAPVRPDALVGVASDASLPLPLRYYAADRLTRGGTAVGRAAARELYAFLVGASESSDDLLGVTVSHIDDVRLVERVARDDQRSVFARTQAAERLVELGHVSTAEECLLSLAAAEAGPGAASGAAAALRDLGHAAASRRLLLDGLHDPEAAGFEIAQYARTLAELGAPAEAEEALRRMAADRGIGAFDRLTAVEALGDVAPAALGPLLAEFALDRTLPSDVRHMAASGLLDAGDRSMSTDALRRLAEDPWAATEDRVDALTDLAEVDARTAAEIVHRMLDESGLTDRHLWRLLDLADALTPDARPRRRLEALIDDETVPPDDLLHATSDVPLAAAIVPRLRRAVRRIADVTADRPNLRALAVHGLLGLIPYRHWRTLMAGLGEDRLHALSLHAAMGAHSYDLFPEHRTHLSFYQEDEGVVAPAGFLAGVDLGEALARWRELLVRRRPEAVTRLRHLERLVADESEDERIRTALLDWGRDAAAPLAERIAAAETAHAYPRAPWYALAADARTPAELRVAVCALLPPLGPYNRIPLARRLASDLTVALDVRAKAAALLAEDLGEEGRRLLRDLAGPHTTDPEAHAAVAAAWEKLGIGAEAVAAFRRVLDDERSEARQRVEAAARLARWREARGQARTALLSVLYDEGAPLGVRIDAAERLLGLREEAEAHLGLLRLARSRTPGPQERERIARLLPDDLRGLARLEGGAEGAPHDRLRPRPAGPST
ncbi:trypsin-like peptidase domain-containing protein [Streptomyces sp. NPDC058733]|uniref:trypsin-like peptidase domain-containing protein n=1 Tax=Streptomyces sp. NPDC058733 TaxID=3346614 RepID=UPI0036827E67